MKFDQNYQRKLLNDVVAQRFDEADDLCQFVKPGLANRMIASSPPTGSAGNI